MTEKPPIVFESPYYNFEKLVNTMIPACDNNSNISLLETICIEYVDRVGDDNLFLECQSVIEQLRERI